MTTDFAGSSRLLEKFFVRRGIPVSVAQDLVQDTWVRYLDARRRGALTYDGAQPLSKMAGWVLADHRVRPVHERPSRTGDFGEEARLFQLQPEGGYRRPRQKGSTHPPEVLAAVRSDRTLGMSERALATKYGISQPTIHRIVRAAS